MGLTMFRGANVLIHVFPQQACSLQKQQRYIIYSLVCIVMGNPSGRDPWTTGLTKFRGASGVIQHASAASPLRNEASQK